MVSYYTQRASHPGTLLLTEATPVHPAAAGFPSVPGLWTAAHVAGWKRIVDAVHARGCLIFMQLWAGGRAADTGVLEREGGYEVVGPSEVGFEGGARPRALGEEELGEYVGWFGEAARRFVEEAGGDGVESESCDGWGRHCQLAPTAS